MRKVSKSQFKISKSNGDEWALKYRHPIAGYWVMLGYHDSKSDAESKISYYVSTQKYPEFSRASRTSNPIRRSSRQNRSKISMSTLAVIGIIGYFLYKNR